MLTGTFIMKSAGQHTTTTAQTKSRTTNYNGIHDVRQQKVKKIFFLKKQIKPEINKASKLNRQFIVNTRDLGAIQKT